MCLLSVLPRGGCSQLEGHQPLRLTHGGDGHTEPGDDSGIGLFIYPGSNPPRRLIQRMILGRRCFKSFQNASLPPPHHACWFSPVLQKLCFPDLTSMPRLYYSLLNSLHSTCGAPQSPLCLPRMSHQHSSSPKKEGWRQTWGTCTPHLLISASLFVFIHFFWESTSTMGTFYSEGKYKKKIFSKSHCW